MADWPMWLLWAALSCEIWHSGGTKTDARLVFIKSLEFATLQPMSRIISLRHRQFADALLADSQMNQQRAYESVFAGRGDSAAVMASRLMKRPEVIAYIEEAIAARNERVEASADDVVRDLLDVRDTSINELVEWRIGCCRYCWGFGHLWQFKPSEYRERLASYLVENQDDDPMGLHFPVMGGDGFDFTRDPNPDCPECRGEGVGRQHINDTRTLSRGAMALYAGVKRGKNGIEVLLWSKDKARDTLARHTGVSKDNVTIKGKIAAAVVAAAPLLPTTIDPKDAGRAYTDIMSGE